MTSAAAVAGTALAAGAAVKAIVEALAGMLRTRSDEVYPVTLRALQESYPDRAAAELRQLARLEQSFEAEFQRKMLARVRRDLAEAADISDAQARAEAIRAIVDRERRYIRQREEAMLTRSLAKGEQLYLRESSPAGAFWMLSPYVAEHTLDCLAMANQFWPWEVLMEHGPPRHHGCPCYLLGLGEAKAKGLMTDADIPDTADAIRRARSKLAQLEEVWISDDEAAAYVATLIDEAARGTTARHDLRYARGTTKGGEFRPRRGGEAPSVKGLAQRGERLRGVLPHLPRTPAESRTDGRWVGIQGRQVRVPVGRWERTIGGRTYTSPAGGTNVYLGDRLVSEPGSPVAREMAGSPARPGALTSPPPRELGAELGPKLLSVLGRDRDAQAKVSARQVAAGRLPVTVGDGPATLRALPSVGYHLIGRDDLGRLGYVGPAGRLNVRLDRDGRVSEVDLLPTITDARSPKALTRPPRDWEEHAADALAWADSLGERFDARVVVPRVDVDRSLGDHAGGRAFVGDISLGRQAPRDIVDASETRLRGLPLSDLQRRGVYATAVVTAEEVAHGVNPISAESFTGADANLEEALAHELAHPLALERLTAQGQHDVVEWAKANPDSLPVQGTYQPERAALATLLDQAGLEGRDRENTLFDLKFRTPPGERIDRLAELTGRSREQVERTLGDPKLPPAAAPASPGVPVIPDYTGVELTGGKAAGGSTGAKILKAEDGTPWLLKTYGGDRNRVATELLANAVYRDLGANVANAGMLRREGEPDFSTIPDVPLPEPPFEVRKGQRRSTGIIVREPDGRMWIYEPKGHFGGYEHTFPKGGVEKGMTPQQNAHKELWEETGLHAAITGYVGDFQGDTGVTRYYVAVRTGGEPHADDATPYVKGGSETAAVKLVSPSEAAQLLNRQRDRKVLGAALEHPLPAGPPPDDPFPEAPQIPALAYPLLDGKPKPGFGANPARRAALAEHYMADALVANWDFVGLADDNVLWDGEKAIRVDQGGTFEYRAQGASKPFGDVPSEVWTMLAKGQGKGKVDIDEPAMKAQAASIAKTLTPDRVDELVDAAPFGDEAMRERIRGSLKARVAWMDRFAKGEEQLPKPAEGAAAAAAMADAQNDLMPTERELDWVRLLEDPEWRDRLSDHVVHKVDDDQAAILSSVLAGLIGDARADEDIVLFRRLRSPLPSAAVGKSLVGQDFLDLDLEPGDGHQLRVTVPAGAPVLSLAALGLDTDASALMGRRQRLKITAVRWDGTRVIVDAVALPPSKYAPTIQEAEMPAPVLDPDTLSYDDDTFNLADLLEEGDGDGDALLKHLALELGAIDDLFDAGWMDRLAEAIERWPAGTPGGLGGQFKPSHTDVSHLVGGHAPKVEVGSMAVGSYFANAKGVPYKLVQSGKTNWGTAINLQTGKPYPVQKHKQFTPIPKTALFGDADGDGKPDPEAPGAVGKAWAAKTDPPAPQAPLTSAASAGPVDHGVVQKMMAKLHGYQLQNEGPGGQPRNVSAMSTPKLVATSLHPDAEGALTERVRAELKTRGYDAAGNPLKAATPAPAAPAPAKPTMPKHGDKLPAGTVTDSNPNHPDGPKVEIDGGNNWMSLADAQKPPAKAPEPAPTPAAPAVPAAHLLPNAVAGGFVPYGSSAGPGGKYKHDRIGDMPQGAVFVDKNGKAWKVVTHGSKPVITDGKAHFTVDPKARGKAAEHVKSGVPTVGDPSGSVPGGHKPGDTVYVIPDTKGMEPEPVTIVGAKGDSGIAVKDAKGTEYTVYPLEVATSLAGAKAAQPEAVADVEKAITDAATFKPRDLVKDKDGGWEGVVVSFHADKGSSVGGAYKIKVTKSNSSGNPVGHEKVVNAHMVVSASSAPISHPTPAAPKPGKKITKPQMVPTVTTPGGQQLPAKVKDLDLAAGDVVQFKKGGWKYTLTEPWGDNGAWKAVGPNGVSKWVPQSKSTHAVTKHDGSKLAVKADAPTAAAPAKPTLESLGSGLLPHQGGAFKDLPEGTVFKTLDGKLAVLDPKTPAYTGYLTAWVPGGGKVEVPLAAKPTVSSNAAVPGAMELLKGSAAGPSPSSPASPKKAVPKAPTAKASKISTADSWKGIPNGSESKAKVAQWQAGTKSKLTAEQIGALKGYTDGSYSTINNALRNEDLDVYSFNEVQKLDSVFDAIDGIKEDIITHRGTHLGALTGVVEPGKVIYDRGFMSTSPTKPWDKQVILHIRLKKGSKALWGPTTGGDVTAGEDEIILRRATMMQVLSVEDVGGKKHIYVEAYS